MKRLFLFVAFSLCLTAGEGKGQEQTALTGQEVMAKVKENFERGVTTVIEEFSMVWTDKQRRSITRELIRREKKYEEGDRISLEVTSGRGEGIKVLIHEVRGGTNLQWVWVGRRERPIDASDKSQRFLNGPTHEDLEFWHCKNFSDFDFNTQPVQEVVLDGRPCHFVRAVPRNLNSSEYSSLEIWVEMERLESGENKIVFTRQIKYYKARSGERQEGEELQLLQKTLRVVSFTRTTLTPTTEVYRPDRLELVEETGCRTVFQTKERGRQLNVAIKDTFFTKKWFEE